MLSKQKYFGSLLVLCISAVASLIYLPDWLAPLALVGCVGGTFGLVLKSIFGAAHQARRRHESLVSLIRDLNAQNKVAAEDEEIRGSQLERSTGQSGRAAISLGDASMILGATSDEIKRRATAEWKIKVMDDLAMVRELLENDIEPAAAYRQSRLSNNEF